MHSAVAALSLRQYDLKRDADQRYAPKFLLPETHWNDEASQCKVVRNISNAIDELLLLRTLHDTQKALIKCEVQAPTKVLRSICVLRAYAVAYFLNERNMASCDIEREYATFYGYHEQTTAATSHAHHEQAWHAEIANEAHLVRAIITNLGGDLFHMLITLVREKNSLEMDIETHSFAMPERVEVPGGASSLGSGACGDSSGSDSDSGSDHDHSMDEFSIYERIARGSGSGSGSDTESGSGSDCGDSSGSERSRTPPLKIIPALTTPMSLPVVSAALPVVAAIPILPKNYMPSARVQAQLVCDGL